MTFSLYCQYKPFYLTPPYYCITMLIQERKLMDLYETLLLLDSKQEAVNFFKDLCTPQELTALNERWRVCQLLETGKYSYREIHSLTGASITTIGRVARFLKDEPYHGYKTMLNKVKHLKTREDHE